MILTYDTLKTTLITNAARPNDEVLISQIPMYILFGQIDLTRKLNLLGTEKIVQGELQTNVNSLIKPALWLRTISFSVCDPTSGKITVLERRNLEYLNIYTPDITLTGEPLFYAEKDLNTLVVAPTPKPLENNETYKYEMIYHELYSPLSSDTQQNILTQRYPDLLMYACSIQMYMALESFSLMQGYEGKYTQGIQDALQLDHVGITDRGQNLGAN